MIETPNEVVLELRAMANKIIRLRKENKELKKLVKSFAFIGVIDAERQKCSLPVRRSRTVPVTGSQVWCCRGR